jgi:hypothetical protein
VKAADHAAHASKLLVAANGLASRVEAMDDEERLQAAAGGALSKIAATLSASMAEAQAHAVTAIAMKMVEPNPNWDPDGGRDLRAV